VQAAAEIHRKLRAAKLHVVTTPTIYRTELSHADFKQLADALEAGLRQ
jgi:hypothetical protein